ncbi:hypothetical protein [Streptomyces sp. NPDC057910]|uniref:hypothetical protein n=1 Tax=Streptomyces sp. NPDC057910 TaxID=3346278 RepID=UPI0036EF6083
MGCLTRARLDADTPCHHCGHRPSDQKTDPLATLTGAITTQPRNRTNRSRTSPRTAEERRNSRTREAVYTITTTESNLLKAA